MMVFLLCVIQLLAPGRLNGLLVSVLRAGLTPLLRAGLILLLPLVLGRLYRLPVDFLRRLLLPVGLVPVSLPVGLVPVSLPAYVLLAWRGRPAAFRLSRCVPGLAVLLRLLHLAHGRRGFGIGIGRPCRQGRHTEGGRKYEGADGPEQMMVFGVRR